MKTQSLATLVAVAASLQGVVATWHNVPVLTCPGKTPVDKCEPHQHGGFNWGDLNLGSFDHYGGLDFSGGWNCKSSFGGRKRDALLPRTFGSKCITGTAHSDKDNCPKIKAKSVDKFSITHLQVSVEFDCELEFHYTLPGNKVCKQKSHCKKSGTTVENTQCGGATDVTVVYPKPPRGGKAKCDIGIHSIGFDCPSSTATASTVASTTTAAPSVETTPTAPETTDVPETTAVPETTPPVTTDEEETPTATETEVTLTSIVTDVTVTSCPVTLTHVTSGLTSIETTLTTSTVVLTSTKTFCPKCTRTKPTGPEETGEVPTETETVPEPTETETVPEPTETETVPEPTETETVPEPTETETVPEPTETETVPEPTETETSPEPTTTEGTEPTETETVPEPTETETSPEPTTTEGAEPTDVPSTTEAGPEPTDTTVAPPQTTDDTSPGGDSGLPCPPVLPQCIKTWLPVDCKSNSDIACFCPKPDFTKKLFECLAAFGASEEEIDDAAEFFQGICAPYVPTNPGIVTDCPTKGVETTTKKPHTVPVTTIVVETTVTVPCEPTGTATETTFTVTTISTQVTVPQVVLTSTNSDVIVVTGPATVEATQTAPLPVATTPAGAVPVATVPVGFTTSRAGAAAGTGTGGLPQPTQPAFVPGSASKSAVSAGVLGAVMALVALVV